MAWLALAILLTLAALPTGASTTPPPGGLRGRVLSAGGGPVPGASVHIAENETPATLTDAGGGFRLAADCPCRLVVTRDGHAPATVDVRAGERPTIVLAVIDPMTEEILVSGVMPADHPVWVASVVVEPASSTPQARVVTEAVATLPGVADNGQGGLFQVTSIRGMSARRQLTLLSGMRIEGFRRAGVALSFVDPLLLQEVEVVRGPMSTSYGPGALSGVLAVEPARRDRWSAATGFDGRGNESSVRLSGGWPGGTVALAHRRADNSEDAEGRELNTHFRQLSGVADLGWNLGGHELRALALVSRGDDIGKDNVDFPRRTTDYPEERHLGLKLSLASTVWAARAYVHDNDLTTRVTEARGRYEVWNEATDYGGALTRDLRRGRGGTLRLGVDLFGRSGVSAREREGGTPSPGSSPVSSDPRAETLTLDDGEHREASGFTATQWRIAATRLEIGARGTRLEQNSGSGDRVTESSWDGFVGAVSRLARGWELHYGLSSGSRFPDLGERFFTGTTPRGRVVGVPDLDPERALNAEIGLRYRRGTLTAGIQAFRNEIDDYIEQIDLDDEVSTFRNLTTGTVEGVEIQGRWTPSGRFLLSWSAHAIEGRADDGTALAHIPADRVNVTASRPFGRWSAEASLEHRWAKDDPGSGELPLDSADTASMRLRYEPTSDLAVTLYGRNLTDTTYRVTADRKSSLATGRTWGLAFTWRG